MSPEVINLFQRLIQNARVNTGSPDSGHEHRSVATLQEFFGDDRTMRALSSDVPEARI